MLTDAQKINLYRSAIDELDAEKYDTIGAFNRAVICRFADLVLGAAQCIPEASNDDDIGEITATNANAGMIGML